MSDKLEIATFGAGCFWGVEEAFRIASGVLATAVGYMGGTRINPTYEQVCSNTTGHVEVVEVTYDPQKISYRELLKLFWSIHDPTMLNRQGLDVGNQYRSVIFFNDEAQRKEAESYKKELSKSGSFSRPIVTAIEPAKDFWRAEEYHQRYIQKGGVAGCPI